jgi:hypothetical protein
LGIYGDENNPLHFNIDHPDFVMIEVRYDGGMGNNMFQYCLGRILAEELGFALQAGPIAGFPNTDEKIDGLSIQDPVQVLTGQKIDWDEVRADQSHRRIVLDGWFQRFEYYRPWRHKIRQWLAIHPAVRTPDIKPGVVVHIRRADYVRHGWALPYSYYDEALETLLPHCGDVWIVTDDRHDPFLRKFWDWKPKLFHGTALETILLMSRSPRLVISQSSFSWWPTFLGDVESIICPLPQFGLWSDATETPGIDLIERDRFICLPCTEAYQPTPLESAYQRARLMVRRIRQAGQQLKPR